MPHHLLDVADIGQIFNAADFCDLAEQAIQVGPPSSSCFDYHQSDIFTSPFRLLLRGVAYQ